MRAPIYQVDAFTTRRFAGNPAAVLVLPEFPADATLLAIAAENNLAETAFLVRQDADYRLRWFTPAVEVPLCGHATLASAAVVMEKLEPGRTQVTFHTASGALIVKRGGMGYRLDLPAHPAVPVPVPAGLPAALGVTPQEFRAEQNDYLAVLDSAAQVRALAPDMAALARLDKFGVVVTAPGDPGYDFISRYFAPGIGIAEDPVTGAAHCILAPYWSERLHKREFRAFQASKRGGEMLCRLAAGRVELEGAAVFYMEGMAEI